MRIAILGWGSLIWRPENLAIISEWFTNGPQLPIEFARISADGRLTLVIREGTEEVQTLYSISKYNNLDAAILNLKDREGCGKNKIGYFIKTNGFYIKGFRHSNKISSWVEQVKDIDAVIWTNLSPNFKDKLDLDLNEANAVNYLKYLSQDIQAKAEEYIRKAPTQINTPIRRAIEQELHWNKM